MSEKVVTTPLGGPSPAARHRRAQRVVDWAHPGGPARGVASPGRYCAQARLRRTSSVGVPLGHRRLVLADPGPVQLTRDGWRSVSGCVHRIWQAAGLESTTPLRRSWTIRPSPMVSMTARRRPSLLRRAASAWCSAVRSSRTQTAASAFAAAKNERRGPGDQGNLPAVGTMHHDVVPHRRRPPAQGLEDCEFLDGVRGRRRRGQAIGRARCSTPADGPRAGRAAGGRGR